MHNKTILPRGAIGPTTPPPRQLTGSGGELYLMGDERGMQLTGPKKQRMMTAAVTAAMERGGPAAAARIRAPLVATRDISDKKRIHCTPDGKCSSPDAAEREQTAELPQLRAKQLLTANKFRLSEVGPTSKTALIECKQAGSSLK